MKRVLYAFICLMFLSTALYTQGATTEVASINEKQADPVRDAKEYAGRYVFNANGSDEVVIITVVNDSLLNVSASMGEAYIQRAEKDKFEFTSFNGFVEFTPNKSKKIIGFKLTIEDAGVYDLEARKEEKKD